MRRNKKITLKTFFNWSSFLGTLTVFLFMWGLSNIGLQFEMLNVFEQVMSDYELTDVYYTKFRKPEEAPADARIVLVNIGMLDRAGIADEINILNQFEPKVIGIDARLFGLKEDTLGDMMLADAIANTKHFVLGSNFDGGNAVTNLWDTLLIPHPMILGKAETGFVNIGSYQGSGEFVTWRTIPPIDKTSSNITEKCFAGVVANLYDKEKTDIFFNRKNELENIYFKGNFEKYTKIDLSDIGAMAEDPASFPKDFLKDKIVLMGYMGRGSYTDYFFDEDKFYTPLNENSIGRGFPDMYGVVVHANIISMILDETYIDEMPGYISFILAILVCYFNAVFFTYILKDRKLAPLYGLTKIVQLVEILIVFGITVWLFNNYQYQAQTTLTVLVILLSGDLIEIYMDIIETSFKKALRKI